MGRNDKVEKKPTEWPVGVRSNRNESSGTVTVEYRGQRFLVDYKAIADKIVKDLEGVGEITRYSIPPYIGRLTRERNRFFPPDEMEKAAEMDAVLHFIKTVRGIDQIHGFIKKFGTTAASPINNN